ncbi:MAG TPA: hypothetical protein VGH42_14315 [Verrucomicrobiae bacterium]|jgi:hypothetical protein
MKIIFAIFFVSALLVISAQGQGSFQNLGLRRRFMKIKLKLTMLVNVGLFLAALAKLNEL